MDRIKGKSSRLLRGILTAAVTACLFACTPRDRYIAITGYAQGGTYAVKLNREGVRESPEQIHTAIEAILRDIDTSLSGYNPGSLLSRYNKGENIIPNGLLQDIFSQSRLIYEKTGGAVDVAAAELYDAWGFGFTGDSLPAADRIAAILARCGMDRLPADFPAGKREGPVVKLNFNAVAQGYSCDTVARYLYSIGVKDMLVDIGEIYCDGLNPAGKPWSIGIDRPVDGNLSPGSDLEAIWQSGGRAAGIVTSGNYRKFHIRDGRKYAHTIDPRTGYPVQHNLLSATIVAPNAFLADAYATYCMVVGLEKAEAFIRGDDAVEGYLIYDEEGKMREWASEGFRPVSANP